MSSPQGKTATAIAVTGPGMAGPEVDRVMSACVFAIATGRWAPDDPVPSVRRGAELWGAAPATVHQAYQLLAERGVLVGRSRRGFFVRPGRPVEHLVRHLETLSRLYDEVRGLVAAVPGLSPVGAFRHMLRQAERDATARPECGFVECTPSQSRRHALEIEARLGLACHALDTHAMQSADWHPPPGLRVLVTTAFHAEEVEPAATRRGIRAFTVPLTCSAEDVRRLSAGISRLEIRSAKAEQGRLVADDVRGILGDSAPEIEVRGCSPTGLESELVLALGSPEDPARGVAVVLSMYLWDNLPERWRQTGAVHPYPYRIDPRAWTDLAGSLGLPLAI